MFCLRIKKYFRKMVAFPLSIRNYLPDDQNKIEGRAIFQVINALKAIEAVIEFVILKPVTVDREGAGRKGKTEGKDGGTYSGSKVYLQCRGSKTFLGEC